ncbi:TonB-dependent siderophore receptor [Notoacmeibacter ruber]|uniref:TonB-dependent siderophore receptor n=1 Tax=Notoacmeibacter ruber TaxID=2670375 RepID=A0A3L7JEG6_9HYPH|nr:TonB-dependent siderophore receptor [Notoacmeibacter ruber]RLQ89178.1 TonB-dependent siderophore receptor [Notoacmeibacter ruber]
MKIERTGLTAEDAMIHYRKAMLLGCTALAVFMPFHVWAQEQPAGRVTTLETITVETPDEDASAGSNRDTPLDDDANSIVATQTTGGGKLPTDILETPASISVVTAKELQRRDADSVEEALNYTAGVNTDFYSGDDRFDYFRIRGFDAYHYRDGLTLGDPFGGPREEIYAYERIEVLKGANSTIFGVSDPGGSVNYVTKLPKSDRFGEVYVSGGSFDHKEIGIDFGDNITSDDTLSFRLIGKLKDSDKEYDYSQDDEIFLMGGLTWRPTDYTSLSVVFDHLDTDETTASGFPIGTDFDRDRFFGEPDFNYRGVERDTLSVMFDHDFGNGLSVSSNARYSNLDSDYGYVYVAAPPAPGSTVVARDYIANESPEESFIIDAHARYDATFDFIESSTIVGAEFGTLDSETVGYYTSASPIDYTDVQYSGAPASLPAYSDTARDQETRAVYLQQNVTFVDRLTASLGLRHDWIDIDQTNRLTGEDTDAEFDELTTRFGLSYKLTDEFAVYGSYAESVVPASLTVEPERGEQYEVGVKYQPAAFPALLTASFFDLTKYNITRNNPVTLLPETTGEVRVRGLELEAKAELPHNFDLTAAYSYLDTEIIENGTLGNEGNNLSLIPDHLASLWLNYELEGQGRRGDLNVGVGARYLGSAFFDDANTSEAQAAVILDAALSYEVVDDTTLQVNVRNILDEKHVTYGGFGANFYNPGREITATLRRTW